MAMKITFKETGIKQPDEDRITLKPGMTFSITAIQMKPSANYREFPVFNGFDLEGKEKKYYSTSGVIKSQALEMLSRFGRQGDKDGILTSEIFVTVESRKSANGRTFLSFA